jgi:hypothetical protein
MQDTSVTHAAYCVYQRVRTCAQAADVGEYHALRVAVRDAAPPLLTAKTETHNTASELVPCY